MHDGNSPLLFLSLSSRPGSSLAQLWSAARPRTLSRFSTSASVLTAAILLPAKMHVVCKQCFSRKENKISDLVKVAGTFHQNRYISYYFVEFLSEFSRKSKTPRKLCVFCSKLHKSGKHRERVRKILRKGDSKHNHRFLKNNQKGIRR